MTRHRRGQPADPAPSPEPRRDTVSCLKAHSRSHTVRKARTVNEPWNWSFPCVLCEVLRDLVAGRWPTQPTLAGSADGRPTRSRGVQGKPDERCSRGHGGDMSGLPLNCAQGTAAVLARWRGVLSKPLSGATGGVGTGGWLPGMPQATHSTDCVRVHVHACACPCVDRRVCTGVHRCVRARVCRPFSCYVPSLGRFEVETQSRPSWHLTVFIYFANQPFDLTFYSSVWVMFSEPLLC